MGEIINYYFNELAIYRSGYQACPADTGGLVVSS